MKPPFGRLPGTQPATCWQQAAQTTPSSFGAGGLWWQVVVPLALPARDCRACPALHAVLPLELVGVEAHPGWGVGFVTACTAYCTAYCTAACIVLSPPQLPIPGGIGSQLPPARPALRCLSELH